jgi:hypothetical protein
MGQHSRSLPGLGAFSAIVKDFQWIMPDSCGLVHPTKNRSPTTAAPRQPPKTKPPWGCPPGTYHSPLVIQLVAGHHETLEIFLVLEHLNSVRLVSGHCL